MVPTMEIRKFARAACAALLVVGACSLEAQVLSWQQQSPATSPPPRRYASMVYNPATQRCVLFGGETTNGPLNDTWVWDGSSWTELTPPVSPSPRYLYSLAFDPNTQRVILFGGTGTPQYSNETWAWDGATWTQLSPSQPPPPLYGMALACDEQRQVLVGFGGKGYNLTSRATYEFDGSEWIERFPPAPLPAARAQARAIYNVQAGRVQVFGGLPTFQEIWEWDGTAWSQVIPFVLPAPRQRPSIAYDRHLGRAVMFGGWFPLYTFYDEVWLWNGQWAAQPSVVRPSAREAAACTYDQARQQLVLFGGNSSSAGLRDDTWLASSQTASSAAYGTSCGNAGTLLADRPVLGTTAEIRIVTPATQLAFVAVGSNNATFQGQPLPIDLSAAGMTGCTLWTSADLAQPGMAPGPAGTAVLSVAVPNDPAWLGLTLYLQAFEFAPGANPRQVVSTRALQWRLGHH